LNPPQQLKSATRIEGKLRRRRPVAARSIVNARGSSRIGGGNTAAVAVKGNYRTVHRLRLDGATI